ncbi:hypothetical protein [Sphingomonas immobilis]|uniref:Lipoprotein n=1 Tax=Sphingomonas immobilis TaxID=3063997 RepID=A0ABT8ZUV9_9SPHN|nr:hypothetical protein [Sphingomonas sp. CA1-15]MDO7841362.1 hypothetical protein [Sphingomonas sp. CA1-15]
MANARRLISGLLLAALAACASPRVPLRDGLIHAGIKPPLAECMAGRMTRQLSILQLRRLAGIAKAGDSRDLDQFLYRLRALDDERIVTVTGKSAALCAAGIAR